MDLFIILLQLRLPGSPILFLKGQHVVNINIFSGCGPGEGCDPWSRTVQFLRTLLFGGLSQWGPTSQLGTLGHSMMTMALHCSVGVLVWSVMKSNIDDLIDFDEELFLYELIDLDAESKWVYNNTVNSAITHTFWWTPWAYGLSQSMGCDRPIPGWFFQPFFLGQSWMYWARWYIICIEWDI